MDETVDNIFKEVDFDQIKDHPNILIAAHFWEKDRYLAAKACYKFMRAIDDLIDDRKALDPDISCFEKEALTDKVNDWIDCLHQQLPGGIISDELLPSITKYKIPFQLYYNFARSMIYDINHNAFETLDDFIDYAEGASNSPASIFLHLSCLDKST